MSELVKEAVALESLLGVAIKPHLLKKSKSKNIHKIFFLKKNLKESYWFIKVPDSLLLPLLRERLGKLDCVSRGWVLHGFPKSREQAEALDQVYSQKSFSTGFFPNR